MSEWQMLDARLSVFVTPDSVPPATLFRDVVGEDPENSTLQRLTLTKTEIGPFANGAITLQTQPTRIDWLYQPTGLPNPPFLGLFPVAADPLVKLSKHWPATAWFPSAMRVALGFTLLSNTETKETGYRELRQFVDGVPDTPDATDFMYQINRPRASAVGVEGAGVNRLSRWSVVGYRFVALSPQLSQATEPVQHHLRLELDINTSGDFNGVILAEQFGAVVDDLLAGAREISEQGTRF